MENEIEILEDVKSAYIAEDPEGVKIGLGKVLEKYLSAPSNQRTKGALKKDVVNFFLSKLDSGEMRPNPNCEKLTLADLMNPSSVLHIRTTKYDPAYIDIRIRVPNRSKITREIFAFKVGRDPILNDLDRCNCEEAGEEGHRQCGWCREHDLPRFLCVCSLVGPADFTVGPH